MAFSVTARDTPGREPKWPSATSRLWVRCAVDPSLRHHSSVGSESFQLHGARVQSRSLKLSLSCMSPPGSCRKARVLPVCQLMAGQCHQAAHADDERHQGEHSVKHRFFHGTPQKMSSSDESSLPAKGSDEGVSISSKSLRQEPAVAPPPRGASSLTSCTPFR